MKTKRADQLSEHLKHDVGLSFRSQTKLGRLKRERKLIERLLARFSQMLRVSLPTA